MELGFSKYELEMRPMNNTLGRVKKMLAENRETDLQKILSDRESEDQAEKAFHKEVALKTDIDIKIEKLLEDDTLLTPDTGSPEDQAFRVLGCCMSLEVSNYLGSEELFYKQIRCLLLGLPEKE